MDAVLIQELQQKLKREQARLRAVIGTVAKKEGKSYAPTFVEMGEDEEAGQDEAEQYIINASTEEALEPMLARIEHALNKMEKGVYGVCEKCGQDIAPERLRAVPEAEYCLEHAKEAEE
ncbi:MAG: TraR/DksA C4-type zinc finger protein [bacterium]|nr:TraR/DksA C4-type zinc finger protein [bacterium]